MRATVRRSIAMFRRLRRPSRRRVNSSTAVKASSTPVASAARLAGDGKQTRFILDLDQPIQFRAFTLTEPYRVIVDIPEVNFQLAAGTGTAGRGLIKALPLRACDARRLPDRARSDRSGPDRTILCARCGQWPDAAPGARTGADGAHRLHQVACRARPAGIDSRRRGNARRGGDGGSRGAAAGSRRRTRVPSVS